MTNDKLDQSQLIELNTKELIQTNGGEMSIVATLPTLGAWWAALGVYLLWETAGNPVASYNAFMNGWNAVY